MASSYNRFVDVWSAFHLLGGFMFAIVMYTIYGNVHGVIVVGMTLALLWELLENIIIKPYWFPNAMKEALRNVASDMFWDMVGIVLFVAVHGLTV